MSTQQQFWIVHYQRMWLGGNSFSPSEPDPYFLRKMIGEGSLLGADALLTFALTTELPGISERAGIFADRAPPPSVVAAAEREGLPSGVLQGFFPGHTSGYPGWFTRWTSRRALAGATAAQPQPQVSVAMGISRALCRGGDMFLIRIAVFDGSGGSSTTLYNQTAGILPPNSTATPRPCPGLSPATPATPATSAAATTPPSPFSCTQRVAPAGASFGEVLNLTVAVGSRLTVEFSEIAPVGCVIFGTLLLESRGRRSSFFGVLH